MFSKMSTKIQTKLYFRYATGISKKLLFLLILKPLDFYICIHQMVGIIQLFQIHHSLHPLGLTLHLSFCLFASVSFSFFSSFLIAPLFLFLCVSSSFSTRCLPLSFPHVSSYLSLYCHLCLSLFFTLLAFSLTLLSPSVSSPLFSISTSLLLQPLSSLQSSWLCLAICLFTSVFPLSLSLCAFPSVFLLCHLPTMGLPLFLPLCLPSAS